MKKLDIHQEALDYINQEETKCKANWNISYILQRRGVKDPNNLTNDDILTLKYELEYDIDSLKILNELIERNRDDDFTIEICKIQKGKCEKLITELNKVLFKP
jgi:hypothetical protein